MLSNIIKSGFVAFADDNRLVIDSNNSVSDSGRIIRSIGDKTDEIETLELDDILSDDNYKDSEFEEKKAYADILIRDARTQADKLLEEARTQAAQIMEDARKNGYQAGYSEGESRARADVERELEEERRKLLEEKAHGEKQLMAERELFLQAAEPKMAEIAARLITHLTGIVVDGQQGVMTYMIDQAMRGIENSQSFVIKVSEGNYPYVAEHKNEIYGASNPSIRIEIFADAKLTANQCLIETDNGIVNCSLDVQLENLSRAIRLMSIEQG